MESVKTIQIPEGYVIDKERSNDNEIVLKLKTPYDEPAKSWEDYVKKMAGKPSFYADYYDRITESVFKADQPWPLEFADRETLKAYLAFGKLIKLRKDYIKNWKPDWTNSNKIKYMIVSDNNKIAITMNPCMSHALSFPTSKMCNAFIYCHKDLLEEAKTLL